jgi:TIR domain/Sulfatase-modifying factor enzyme 1
MKHVFISYVRENYDKVLQLSNILQASGISVWLDRNDIKPGERWADAIRQAIAEGSFFIACFSAESNARYSSYMNEELTLAIDELRKRPSDRVWFIPVLLSQCDIPDRSIGAGETLRSFEWVELYRDWRAGTKRIVSVIDPSASDRLDRFTNPTDGSAMELVVGGTYVWGNEGDVKEITVADFYLNVYPVTVAQYKLFKARNSSLLKNESWFRRGSLFERVHHDSRGGAWTYPDWHWVGDIDFNLAMAYCDWAHLRLPSLFELEYVVFRAQGIRKMWFGINCGYEQYPLHWTSTMGSEIGKNNRPIIAPVSLGMSRGLAIPWESGSTADFGLRCAASLGHVKTLLHAAR